MVDKPTERSSLARAICEQLLQDFTHPVHIETKQQNERLVQIAYAWANQVHRFVAAALVLDNVGHSHEALVLHRQALEFTIRLHWLVQLGDAGVDSVLADYQHSMGTLATDAANGPLSLPPEYLAQLGDHAIDSKYEFVRFTEAL